jgi:hypothetical protein
MSDVAPGSHLDPTQFRRGGIELEWVRILCDGANLIDSSGLVASALSGSIACG